MASVRQIAKRTGVSVATVSRALNNLPDVHPETRAKVLNAANKSGYAPRIGKRLTTVIGLVYPSSPVPPSYGNFESALLAGILQGTNEQRFDVKIINLQRDKLPKETFSQFFMRKGLRGVVIRTFEESRHICGEIAAEGFPHVVVADRFDDPRINFICTDSKPDTRLAIRHLVELGHSRIGLVVHNIPDTDHRDRAEAYAEAMADAGLPRDPSLRVDVIANLEAGGAAIRRLLSLPDPATAVLFTDPLSTLGAMLFCLEAGVRVPDDLSIVGFDDSDIRTHVYPTLTAVCQDARALGFEAALYLTRALSGSAAPPALREIRPTLFQVNRTTGAPPERPLRLRLDAPGAAPRRA